MGLAVLAALGAAGEPVTAATLARLSQVDNEQAVRRWCDLRLRAFLNVTAGPDRRYSIYHASLRELLRGDLPAGEHPDHRWTWAQRLRLATDVAHHRIADHYLDAFGSLHHNLALLATQPTLAVADDGYPLRHLTHHLAQAGRWSDLHQLLISSYPGDGRETNVWFTAHDQADTLDEYLDDLHRARRHAAATSDTALAAGGPAPALAREVLYALMVASIHSITNNIQTDLLIQLATSGLWRFPRALAHARRLADPGDRSRALAGLAPHLPADQQPHVLAQALTAATTITDEYSRAEALTGLAPTYPPTNSPKPSPPPPPSPTSPRGRGR